MPGRDLEAEFDEIMVGLAAADPNLVDHFSQQMFGEAGGGPEPLSWSLVKEIKLSYVLNDELFARSVGRCVARLAGIKTGEEFFSVSEHQN